MKLAWPVEVAGTGVSVPDQVVTNHDFAQRLDTSDEWIVQRTGIRERRIVAPQQSTLDLAEAASREALQGAGLAAEDIDLIIVATITPEHLLPATSCELQDRLGCRQVPAFDIQAACCGYVWGTLLASQFVVSGMARNVLIVGAESLTRITDMEDRSTAILFGDGAGASIIRRAQDDSRQIIAAQMGADGKKGMFINVPAGGAALPASHTTVDERLHYMKMRGRDVYKFAVTKMQEVIEGTAAEAGVAVEDIALIVPHQSNERIIESATGKLNIPRERVVINIDRYGNTSAASVGIAFHEARQAGRVKPGDLVMLVAFGAGLTWGSALMRI